MRQIDPYKRICFMCEQADLVPKEVCSLSKTLFTLYQDSKIAAIPRHSPISKEKEDQQKRKLRREFLNIAKLPVDSFDAQKAFVWDALSCPWIDEKIMMVIDKMEMFPPDGPIYKKILISSYLSEYKSELQLFDECSLRKTAFYKKREAALTLFGITMWNYAEIREQEDRDNGLID
ncbi:hypothetical protein [Butyrivibrio sp. YAB3001]|uniref:hypothetical protein n=1 Tax=Butyrivibrio sp. YAB3001 TaxID=1520812 RepID=UPI0008F62BEA|nr:hypothetical protein [Butyrivibrio sp. YAB3001]SFC57114.1 hypothetical protein SAMN02910398_02603 [Butyrivibrio sp. YAB3001]